MCRSSLNRSSWSGLRICIMIVLSLYFVLVTINASSTCSTSSNCSLREWLVKLQDESSALECSLSQLEKSTTLLSKAKYSSTSMRLSQIDKLKRSIAILKGEIEIITLACSTYYGKDCNLTTPECDSKCLSCSSGQCSICSGNWDGPNCSVCKIGWNGTDCNTPICSSNCASCSAPNVCPTCKTGWYGSDCKTPICDSKCVTCSSPGQCTSCSGNWDGATCSVCKAGWNGTLCNVPICDSKCSLCSAPNQCSNCTGNWNGTNCSSCKSGWNGTLCNIPICDSKCITCVSIGQCSNCSGNWDGPNCSVCKIGWNGTDCNTPICSSNCASCSAPNVCPTCKAGWYGSDCTSNVAPPILTSAQITKFKSNILSTAQIIPSKLLYKATRDGFSASTFHSKCDNKGPTITIVQAASGAIFGGYTAMSWTSSCAYTVDSTAFLFSLVAATKEERFVTFSQSYGWYYKTYGSIPNAIYGCSTLGPAFGGGNDIIISANANTNTNSYANLCFSYCDTTMLYGGSTGQSGTYLAGSFNFQVSDYEVYSF